MPFFVVVRSSDFEAQSPQKSGDHYGDRPSGRNRPTAPAVIESIHAVAGQMA
jgi:hypothetical protein